ncbi:MAG TPA: carboxylesterase [Acholeplasmataceae bacterium]|nr:carboxylesterase [Acholeplasmataceae bacterium]
MIHLYINNNSKNTLIMLHGTGADENDLIPLAKAIDSKANILSIRGNINEQGMNRFFKRFNIGSYDLNSFESETSMLAETIKNLSVKYNFNLNNTFVVGFSNGANIAQGLIQDYPNLVKYFGLLSPDYINIEKGIKNNIENNKIFISSAKDDPYTSFTKIEKLISDLETKGANVELYVGTGHRIDNHALKLLIEWYEGIKV